MKPFDGKVALVSGASRGIGHAIAERLVAGGARVVITARKEAALKEAAAALGTPDRVRYVAGSAEQPESRQAAVAAAVEGFGAIDLLVNNTGINPVYGPLLDLDPAAARKIFEVNCLAALNWIRLAREAGMGERGPGAVVNVSSIAGLRPSTGIGFYGATKAMLSFLTSQLSVELAPRIRVNAVAPAVVKTRFATALYEGREEAVLKGYPMGRLGEPEDIAGAVAFLLSDDAAWTTGQTLVVDGGHLFVGEGE
ncbi:SDR family oxidoreductase [Streptomyces luteolus]|uniref:SDR family oxidoreductase n=1 Tax=Streptomyces luteolus TaxID=3043615 RepID=A0ABT6SS17_9ACTN|nr:SDR family oxidoreductase [Streptomyces sp. B-S-A12]MDI3418171.1 SDR family oxidoreductase [Streptomyces sp. B-S-A12]